MSKKSQSGRPYAGRSAAEKPYSGGRRPTANRNTRGSQKEHHAHPENLESSQEREEYAWV